MNEITIELNKKQFSGGETVAGRVLVQLDQDTPLRGIRLMLRGYEQSSWREGSGKTRHTHSQTRTFFDEEITLHGRPRLKFGELLADSFKGAFSKESYESLPAGNYCYPFSYQLPAELPGDYESSVTGSGIHYGVKAQVDLPLKFDLKAEQRLYIQEPAGAAATQEVTGRETKKFLFDSDSQIEAAVHLEKNTFQPGEALHCQLEVMNRAPNKEVRAATLRLRQLETAFADGRTHQGETEIARARFDDCRFPFQQCQTADLELPIPEDVYPSIAKATLVKVDYELEVKLDIPWAIDLKVSVPIKLINAPAPVAA